ncbi:hypothetical protein CC1G_09787 [Coprinopsis cinerea okayama7|uniref:Uncharacterized protein n=1 Tax=Coprinopsis cinerea (strain Okayama-7 / 130 / ATCC MYA-4618 / FGSC 9003) TaxID=240176 RepID=A8NM79_COPC7|nr:hypothetical protein CC1G_09787 [Coprinopsis cinerea okayama7\|eukprot:XP_001834860.2 hypothetical protein CC1G_09787 [Coprinopsis cinerea okayama7\
MADDQSLWDPLATIFAWVLMAAGGYYLTQQGTHLLRGLLTWRNIELEASEVPGSPAVADATAPQSAVVPISSFHDKSTQSKPTYETPRQTNAASNLAVKPSTKPLQREVSLVDVTQEDLNYTVQELRKDQQIRMEALARYTHRINVQDKVDALKLLLYDLEQFIDARFNPAKPVNVWELPWPQLTITVSYLAGDVDADEIVGKLREIERVLNAYPNHFHMKGIPLTFLKFLELLARAFDGSEWDKKSVRSGILNEALLQPLDDQRRRVLGAIGSIRSRVNFVGEEMEG